MEPILTTVDWWELDWTIWTFVKLAFLTTVAWASVFISIIVIIVQIDTRKGYKWTEFKNQLLSNWVFMLLPGAIILFGVIVIKIMPYIEQFVFNFLK